MIHTILVLSPVKQLFALIFLCFKCTLNALAVVLEEATALAVANKKISILLCVDVMISLIQSYKTGHSPNVYLSFPMFQALL